MAPGAPRAAPWRCGEGRLEGFNKRINTNMKPSLTTARFRRPIGSDAARGRAGCPAVAAAQGREHRRLRAEPAACCFICREISWHARTALQRFHHAREHRARAPGVDGVHAERRLRAPGGEQGQVRVLRRARPGRRPPLGRAPALHGLLRARRRHPAPRRPAAEAPGQADVRQLQGRLHRGPPRRPRGLPPGRRRERRDARSDRRVPGVPGRGRARGRRPPARRRRSSSSARRRSSSGASTPSPTPCAPAASRLGTVSRRRDAPRAPTPRAARRPPVFAQPFSPGRPSMQRDRRDQSCLSCTVM